MVDVSYSCDEWFVVMVVHGCFLEPLCVTEDTVAYPTGISHLNLHFMQEFSEDSFLGFLCAKAGTKILRFGQKVIKPT